MINSDLFHGRMSRKEFMPRGFWLPLLLVVIGYIAMMYGVYYIDSRIAGLDEDEKLRYIFMVGGVRELFHLVILYSVASMVYRRIQDTNISGRVAIFIYLAYIINNIVAVVVFTIDPDLLRILADIKHDKADYIDGFSFEVVFLAIHGLTTTLLWFSVLVITIMLTRKGTKGAKKYGADPLEVTAASIYAKSMKN